MSGMDAVMLKIEEFEDARGESPPYKQWQMYPPLHTLLPLAKLICSCGRQQP